MLDKISLRIITILSILIFVLLVGIGVTKVALNKNNISSSKMGRFQVSFNNLGVSNLTGDVKEIIQPRIVNDTTLINDYTVSFNGNGSIVYNLNVVNDGSFDACVSSIVVPKPMCRNSYTDEIFVCEKASYSLTYGDTGVAVSEGDCIQAGDVFRLTLTLNYNGEIPVSIYSLTLPVVFTQR